MIKHDEIVSELKITIQGDMYGKVKYHILGRFNDEGNAPVSGLYDKKIDELLTEAGLPTNMENFDRMFPSLHDLLLMGNFRYVKKGSIYHYSRQQLDKLNYKPKGTSKNGTVELIRPDVDYVVQQSKWLVIDTNSLKLELSANILELFEKLKSHNN